MTVMHRSGINVLFWPHSTSAVATSKASVYSLPLAGSDSVNICA